MKIGNWLSRTEYELLQGSLEEEVSEVVYDSRKAAPGTVFVCMRGSRTDSHDFIPDVVKAGCRVIVTEHEVSVPDEVTVIRTENGRLALAQLSAARFDYPAEKLITIGITGTKGKTTTSFMVKKILEAAGGKTGLIGTNGAVIGDQKFPTANTTPESYLVEEYFHKMVEAGCRYVVMEVSSQAMMLHRVGGIHFDYAMFTNISPDHIGPVEHKDFDEYLYYKSRLLTKAENCIVNRQTDHYEDVVKDATGTLYTYALDEEADFTGSDIRYIKEHDFVGIEFTMKGGFEGKIRVGLPGKFNAENALAAYAVTSLVLRDKMDEKEIHEKMIHALEPMRVDGRMEIAYVSPLCSVIVDYAHNAVSMESLLTTLRDYDPKRLVCVFGCGGNRARDRRFTMGKIGGELADFCILTADNPRFEKNEDIINDIITGIEPTGGKYMVIPDREEAITYAMKHAFPGDMIAVIGKGHEDYQEIEGVRHHFLDREVVEKVGKELS